MIIIQLADRLIERWSKDPSLDMVPYRRMATEAAEEATKMIDESLQELLEEKE